MIYKGLLPDLFREGQGVVVDGTLGADGGFRADSVLAKHDERYMPREVADALKKAGRVAGRGRRGQEMIVETGHFALVLALALALAQAILPFAGARLRDVSLMRVARPVAVAQFLLVAFAYGALTYAHVVSDFSLVNVIENSHSLKPMIYKISGVWGNHEGSMLLWVLVLAACGAAIVLLSRAMPDLLRADTLAVQGLIGAAFLPSSS